VNEPNDVGLNSGDESIQSDDRQAIPMGQQPMGATTSMSEPSGPGEMPPKASDP
jgi:hypothetical protein